MERTPPRNSIILNKLLFIRCTERYTLPTRKTYRFQVKPSRKLPLIIQPSGVQLTCTFPWWLRSGRIRRFGRGEYLVNCVGVFYLGRQRLKFQIFWSLECLERPEKIPSDKKPSWNPPHSRLISEKTGWGLTRINNWLSFFDGWDWSDFLMILHPAKLSVI